MGTGKCSKQKITKSRKSSRLGGSLTTQFNTCKSKSCKIKKYCANLIQK